MIRVPSSEARNWSDFVADELYLVPKGSEILPQNITEVHFPINSKSLWHDKKGRALSFPEAIHDCLEKRGFKLVST